METRDAISRFMDGKAVVWQSRKTVALYQAVLNQYAAIYPELPETPEPVEFFLVHLDLATYTKYNYFTRLRTFYRWCALRLGTNDPTPLIGRLSAHRPRPRILSLPELHQLLLHPGHPSIDRMLLNLFADTGIRCAEAVSITPGDIRPDTVLVTGKGNRQREVPCSPDLCTALIAMGGDPGQPVIPYHPAAVTKLIRRAFKRAGFTGAKTGPHTLRHTFATLWGGSDADLQGILGHSTPAMTLWYRQFRIDRAKADHQRYSPRRQALALGGPVQLPLLE